MINNTLQYYISCFTSMNCNKYRGQVAPHKAMMLIAVMDEITNDHLTNGFVPHNDRMVKSFESAWQRYVGKSSVFNPIFATPFFHLANEPFWKLMKSDCYVEKKEYSLGALRESFYGAKLPDNLCQYMAEPASRKRLMRALLDRFIPNWEDNEEIWMVAESEAHYQTSNTKDTFVMVA